MVKRATADLYVAAQKGRNEMNIDETKTVGELVAEAPGAARVFERLGIDYCCQGRLSLAQACSARGVTLEEVQQGLTELDSEHKKGAREVVWTERPMAELIDHLLSTHHEFTRSELDRAAALATRVAKAHGEKHPEVLSVIESLMELRGDLLPHMEKEEYMLFPYVRGLGGKGLPDAPFGSVAMPVRMMNFEHEQVGRILKTMREQTREYSLPADACPTWRALWGSLQALESDLHMHIHLETNVLFPRAIEAETALTMA